MRNNKTTQGHTSNMSEDAIRIQVAKTTKKRLQTVKKYAKKTFWFLTHTFSALTGLTLIFGGALLVLAMTPSEPTATTIGYLAVLGAVYWYTLRWLGWQLLQTITQ